MISTLSTQGQPDRASPHSPGPLLPSVRQPCPSVLCWRLLQETGGQRTMLALGLNLQNWARNLHRQDLPLRFPHSGLLMLTSPWKCQGPKEARKCVICSVSSNLVTSICTILFSGHPALSILLCLSQLTLALPVCFPWFPGFRGLI